MSRRKRRSKQTTKSNFFSVLKSYLSIPLGLAVAGSFFVFEASALKSYSYYQDSFHFLKLQILWIFLGLIVLTFFSLLDYHKLYYIAFYLITITIVILILIFIPGIGLKVGGARRWFSIGGIRLQPSELTKFSIIIYLSSWFQSKERERFFSFAILLSVIMTLVILQPDMGTAVIIFLISIIIYFIAGIDLYYLLLFIPISLFSFFILIKTSPYRFRRLIAFLNPISDPLKSTYHAIQALTAISNGGLFGHGLGISKEKYIYIPETHTDSIFAIIAEETGFIGSLIFIFFLFLFLYKIYLLIQKSPDRFAKLLLSGIFGYFSLQILINLLGITNIMPLTGVPLSFVSYGGSNMIVSFAFVGIIINIARHTKKFN